MTPEQQVALDAMRSAWPEETVSRMLRAEKPDIEETLITLTAHACQCNKRDSDGSPHFEQGDCWACQMTVAAGLQRPLSLSEEPAGVSTHRSQNETHCPSCKSPVGNAKCWDCYGIVPALQPGHGPNRDS